MADERIFSDPAFQGWVKSIVYEARRTFTSVPDRTLDEIEKANKAPSGLSSKPELLSIVETIYREIVDDGELSYLDLSAQSFASDFRLWGEPSDIFGRVSAESEGAAGSEEGLDIVDGIHAIASEAERISRFVTSSYLREYLSSVAEKLASISSDRYADPSEVIRSVEVLGREVENVSQIMERAEGSRLGAVIPNVLQSAMLAREKAAKDEVDDLERAIWLLERHLELGKFGYRMRELTIEVQMRALDILRRLGPGDSIVVPNDEVLTSSPFDFVDVGDGDPEVEAGKLAQSIFEKGREATTGELATLAWLHLLVGRPEAAVRALSEFDADPVVAGAAFLMAGWRYRLRDNEGFFEDIVMPGIKKAFLMERFAADEAGPSDLGRAPWLEIPIVDELPKVIEAAAKKNASVLLDLGAGDLPFGLEYAAQTSGIHAISIEPDVHPIDWSSIDVRFPPLNHSFLMGRAEELVPFAAESPIAQDAVIVAPGEQSVMSMMLSALLAVEPGGEIFVFQNMEDMLPVDLLQSMGLEVEIFSVDTGKYDPPPSRYLAREGEIRMARIRVSHFGGRRFGGVASGSLRSAGDEGAFERTGRLLKLVLPGPEEENAASVKGSEAASSSSVTTTRPSTGAKIIPFSK